MAERRTVCIDGQQAMHGRAERKGEQRLMISVHGVADGAAHRGMDLARIEFGHAGLGREQRILDALRCQRRAGHRIQDGFCAAGADVDPENGLRRAHGIRSRFS